MNKYGSYMKEHEQASGERLQDKMIEIGTAGDGVDALWQAAVDALGGDVSQYERFYTCLECGQLYHGDYSSNSDPDRDFCGFECEVCFVKENPDVVYRGEFDMAEDE